MVNVLVNIPSMAFRVAKWTALHWKSFSCVVFRMFALSGTESSIDFLPKKTRRASDIVAKRKCSVNGFL